MRILMLNNEFPPLGGGTGTVNKELLNHFSEKRDIKIDLITSEKGKKKLTEQFASNITIVKYPVNNKNIHHSSNFELIKYTIQAFFAALRMHKQKKYELIMAWSTVPAGFVAYLLHVLFHVPYIVRVGGSDIPGFEERYNLIYKIISPIIHLIWKKAELIVAKCETEKQMVHKINPNLSISVIHNGIDTRRFTPSTKPIKKPLKLICSARLIKRKGIDTLIEALALLKSQNIHYQAFLLGEGDEKMNLQTQAKELGVTDCVHFIGYVPREQMPEKYSEADIFVLPSYNEGMSNALLEALASGLPAIVTRVGGTDELIVEGENGFVFEAGNASQLANTLKMIEENSDKIPLYSKNARKKAGKMDWETITQKYLQIFNQYGLHS